MNKRRANWRIAVALIVATWAVRTAGAQPAPEDAAERLRALEQRLEQVEKENQLLRGEIEAIKAALAPAPAEQEDLTAIELAETPGPAAPQPAAEPPIELVQNQPAPAGKVLNPDISVIGNFLGKMGDRNEFDQRSSMSFEEAEIAMQAYVDPYAQAKFFVAVGPEGAELEEGFIDFIALPHDFGLRAGKLKASFGKVNLMHTHQRPWIDQPLVVASLFGGEGLADSGLSVSRILPNRAGLFIEATAEVFSGNAEGVFEAEELNDLLYLGHVKVYRDLTERSNLEIGASAARGTLPETGGSNRFLGVDVTYRFKPLERAIYRSLISRTEIVSNRRAGMDESALGFYTSLDYQFSRRWFAGVRLDRADRPDDPATGDRGASVILTFWPSEFSQLRAQARRTRYGPDTWANELLLQIQFSIGAHGAHTF